MTELIQPKLCAVCHQVLDRLGTPFGGTQWIHSLEIVGKSDHVAVPVDYADVPVKCMCDFCFDEVPTGKIWTVVATDFKVPVIGSMSDGGWAACSDCAQIADRRAWSEMVERYLAKKGDQGPEVRQWLGMLYAELEKHMTEVRPWRAGDEKVSA